LAFSQFEHSENIGKDVHLGVGAHIKMFDDNLVRYGILVTDVLFLVSDNTKNHLLKKLESLLLVAPLIDWHLLLRDCT
jgi:hypothetical protein